MRQQIEFEAMNPFRRPEWRYERVLQMVDNRQGTGPGRSTARDDDAVKTLRRFILRYRGASSNPVLMDRLAYENPALYWAFLIHVQPENEQHLRTTLESRILARQSDEEIAGEMKTLPDVVRWYEQLFFHVRDRLDSIDWISNYVLIPAFLHSRPAAAPAGQRQETVQVAQPYFDCTIKFLAYCGGRHALDFALTGMRRFAPALNAESVGNWFMSNYAERGKMRAMQAMNTVNVNQFNVMDLWQTVNQLITIEKSSDSEAGKRDAMLRLISAMMTQMPWAVGREAGKKFAGTQLGQLDERAAELRDDELLLMASGRPVGTIDGIEQLKLPPPPERKRGQEDQHADHEQGS